MYARYVERLPYSEWTSPLTPDVLAGLPAGFSSPRLWGRDIGVLRPTGANGSHELWVYRGRKGRPLTHSRGRVGGRLYVYGGPSWLIWDDEVAWIMLRDASFSDEVGVERTVLARFSKTMGQSEEFLPLSGSAQGFPVRYDRDDIAYIADHESEGYRTIELARTTGCELLRTRDLVSDVVVSEHSSKVAWVTWPSGTMPWESAQAWVAPHSKVSLAPQRYGPDLPGAVANLFFVGEELYGTAEIGDRFVPVRLRVDGHDVLGEFPGESRSDWFFGWRWSAQSARGLHFISLDASTTGLASFSHAQGFTAIENSPRAISEIDAKGHRLIATGSDGETPSALYRYSFRRRKWTTLADSSTPVLPHSAISTGVMRRSESGVPFVYYEPKHPEWRAPDDDRPALILDIHGGPTAYTGRRLRYDTQLMTSSGVAVASVDYRGSTSYGANYRRALNGGYGIKDVADVLNVARYLIGSGEVDPSRVFVRGGSSGGLTALLCGESQDIAGVIAHYPVTDALLLDEEAPEIEAGYLSTLVGASHSEVQRFHDISPMHRESPPRRVLLTTGANDRIVPVESVRAYAERLMHRGSTVTYMEFDGEGHGYKATATRSAVSQAELAFVRA